MSDRRAASSGSAAKSAEKSADSGRSQISGPRKDEFIRGVLEDIPHLDENEAARIAEHLCGAIDIVKTDRQLIARYRKSRFDPNAFSLMKVYRTSGERGLWESLRGIAESRHLQALARAQQISLPRRLRTGSAAPADLKEAIVKGVISRHDDWRAAS